MSRTRRFVSRHQRLWSVHLEARAAGDYWCDLLATHRPGELLAARRVVFDRWPSSHHGSPVARRRQTRLGGPADRGVAHNLGLSDPDTWTRLVKEYQKHDPLAVLPVLADLVTTDLLQADARNYHAAARRLRTMRKLAADSEKAHEVEDLIAALRENTAADRDSNASSTAPACPDRGHAA